MSESTLRRRGRAAIARSVRGDRSLAAFVGLLLLVAGVLVALLGYGVFGAGRAARPLLDPMIADWIRAQPAAARVIAIVTGLGLTVLGLVWTARSLRPENRPDLRVEAGADTEIVVASGAFAEAVAGQATALPGVGKARARMVGSEHTPALRITLWLSDDADVTAVLTGLEETVLTSARTSLGLAELPVAVRLELDNPPPARRVR